MFSAHKGVGGRPIGEAANTSTGLNKTSEPVDEYNERPVTDDNELRQVRSSTVDESYAPVSAKQLEKIINGKTYEKKKPSRISPIRKRVIVGKGDVLQWG